MRILTFVYAPHRDRVNEERCRMSGELVHPDTTIYDCGRKDMATCRFCGRYVNIRQEHREFAIEGGEPCDT